MQAWHIGSSLYADNGEPQDLQLRFLLIIRFLLETKYLCAIFSLVASSLHSEEQ
jgi:hypothetical protein